MASAFDTTVSDASSTKKAPQPTTPNKVGFLITAVDAETKLPEAPDKAEPSPMHLISVYRVEDAELPFGAMGGNSMCAPLPQTIPMEKVMTNIVQNLDFKAWSENARNVWFRDFKSPPSRAVIGDVFWYCICWYFKPAQHTQVERRLFDRVSANFVALFCSVSPKRKDFFFQYYADAVAQAVLYAMFLAYPKSRVHFTEKFRKDLIIRISYWTSGVCPEFVDASHWKLNLGGGDVLQATSAHRWNRRPPADSLDSARTATSAVQVHDSLNDWEVKGAGHRSAVAHRAPRPLRRLGYSPLVGHFLKSRKYSSLNLVPATKMCMTTAEERAKLMDVKHAMLLDRATAAREHCEAVVADYNHLVAEARYQERQKTLQAQAAKNRLEIRRKEVLRSDPREYANYLVSLHVLQQGLASQG
mmetsp:Transcript_27282/g.62842  ORF Transcript_27282/g.62842 Transcript_27282/m.62842 type:complete len:415 (+) Transcript_27282:93-1337(+)